MSPRKKQDLTQGTVSPPDGGYGWIIVTGALLTHLLLVGMARSLGMIYEDLRYKFQGSAAATAWVAAIFNTCRSLIAPVCGLMCKKLSCRTVAMLGGLVMAAGLVISAFANSLYYLYATFAITGFGGAMVFTPAYVMVGSYFDKNKGKAMGLATIGSGLGSIILAPTVTALLYNYSFFGTMIMLGGIQLHNCVAGALYRPVSSQVEKYVDCQSKSGDNVEQSEMKSNDTNYAEKQLNKSSQMKLENSEDLETKDQLMLENSKDPEKGDNCRTNYAENHLRKCSKKKILSSKLILETSEDLETKKDHSKTLKTSCCHLAEDSLFRNFTFYLYGYLIMSMQICIQSYVIFLPGYAKEYGASTTEASLLLSIFGFVDMIGRLLFGILFDLKWISRRRKDFYCLVSALFGLGAMSLTFMPNFVSICVMTVWVAMFEGATHSQRATVLSDFVPVKQMPTAVGVIIFCQGVGNVWGPPFAGFLRDITGTNAYGFIFCGSVMFSASLLFYMESFLFKCCSFH